MGRINSEEKMYSEKRDGGVGWSNFCTKLFWTPFQKFHFLKGQCHEIFDLFFS